jgi:glucose/arabinose dehydrogenase
MVVDEREIVSVQDFIYGWLLDDGQSAGRPVDLIFDPYDGALYVSDDKAGVIYRVTRGD